MIEAQTYRHYGHRRTDPAKYRPAEEVERWLKHDPLTWPGRGWRRAGSTSRAIDQVDAARREEVAAAVERGQGAPDADPSEDECVHRRLGGRRCGDGGP